MNSMYCLNVFHQILSYTKVSPPTISGTPTLFYPIKQISINNILLLNIILEEVMFFQP